MKNQTKIITFVLIFALSLVCLRHNTIAKEDFSYLKLYSLPDFSLQNQLHLNAQSFGFALTGADLGGDGQDELIVSAGRFVEPRIKILRQDGSLINSFLAYNKNFIGGVEVEACDLDNDGRDEILTGVRSNGGAHIRIFDSYGREKISANFFAFQGTSHGVRLSCGDVTGNGQANIIATSKVGDSVKVAVFNNQAELIVQKSFKDLKAKDTGVSLVDLGGDGQLEILLTAGWGDKPLIKILRGDLSLINEFLAFEAEYKGGVRALGLQTDRDVGQEIIVAPAFLGGSKISVFNSYGNLLSSTEIFNKNFVGGFNLDIIKTQEKNLLAIVPRNLPTGNTDEYKYIDIDVSEQRFKYYERGYLIDDLITSTGKPSTPTRYGEFKTLSKYEMAYGGADGQLWGMPYFIGFYTAGGLVNGIHELPFLNGYREGQNSLGHAVSHGCVRLGIGSAKEVYDWTEVDKTKIIVHP